MVTLYNVISGDGYITERDGSEDFMPDDVFDDYIDLCKKSDVVVMGRRTYEAIQKYPKLLLDKFENLAVKKAVVTHDREFILKQAYIRAFSPEDAVALGNRILVSSGPGLNSYFLRKGMIDLLILNKLNKKINKGIKPFDIDIKKFIGNPVSTEVKNDRTMLTYKIHNLL